MNGRIFVAFPVTQTREVVQPIPAEEPTIGLSLPGPVEAMTRDNYFFALGRLDQQLRHVAEDLKEMCVRVEGMREAGV